LPEAWGIPRREDPSPRNGEAEVPLAGCFGGGRPHVAWRSMTTHLIVLAIVAAIVLAVYLIRRR
jgi:hypothetical protein